MYIEYSILKSTLIENHIPYSVFGSIWYENEINFIESQIVLVARMK